MKAPLLVAFAAIALSACAARGPATAWGKEGVSMLDYRTDSGQCAVVAATYNPQENGANTAGGVNGQNASIPVRPGENAMTTGINKDINPGSAANQEPARSNSGGSYRDSDNADFVQRAITQQRAQEMAAQRARTGVLHSCLVERGYTEFALTADQKNALAKLPPGSDARRAYLYKLGTDPAVLATQKTVPAQ